MGRNHRSDSKRIGDNIMLLLTQYSPSHKHLYDQFIKPKVDQFDKVIVHEVDQVCDTANYGSPGFNEHMWLKLDHLASVSIGEQVIYLDADCMISSKLSAWCHEWLINNKNIIGHGNDSNSHCMGVLLFEQTESTVQWWKTLKTIAQQQKLNDQETLNWLITNHGLPPRLAILPKNIIANWSSLNDTSEGVWKGEPLQVPTEALCWHANYCIGVDAKLKMLERVEQYGIIT
jgi:hypothetical protein